MATYDNAYSRLVASLKVGLPLAALMLLSTLFLFSRNIDTDSAIPYAEVDVEEMAREQRIGAPAYSGVALDGTAFQIAAVSARPDLANQQAMSADTLQARLELPSGVLVTIWGETGVIDTTERKATLEGAVQFETSTGYVVLTEHIVATLDATEVVAKYPIKATGPLCRLEAGRMALTRQETGTESFLLVFNNQVKLVYEPPE